MQRIFLSWDKPACQLVAERLLNCKKDIYRHVVLVPTKESGRQLREQLAVHAAHQAIFPPTVMPADQFLQMGDTEERAGNIEELAAWVMALGDDAFETYGALFPKRMPADFSCLLDVAANMQKLRRDMAAQGVTCEKAAAACGGEDERWPDIASLTQRYTVQLKRLGLKDRAELCLNARLADALLAQLKESGGSIIVACVPDLTSPLCRALRHADECGIPVQIWVHAPEAEADNFDAMGHPLQSVWEERPIPLTDDQITVTANPERLAEEVCRQIAIMSQSEDGAPDIALGVCDQDMNVALDAQLRQYGWGLHNPEGRPFAGTGLMDLLKSLSYTFENEGKANNIISLARSSLLCLSLGIKNQRECCCVLDKIRDRYLPEQESYLISCLKKHYPGTEKALQPLFDWKNNMLIPGQLGSALMQWIPNLETVYGNDAESLQILRKSVEGLLNIQSLCDDFHAPEKAIRLLMRSLQNSRIKSERSEHAALDSLGWMELPYRTEKHLIITGLNEGAVPEGGVEDQFMPEPFKNNAGMNSLARIKARDSYLLTAMLLSRNLNGNISIILSRSSSKNDPLTPSSLLMRCAEDTLAARVNKLFKEIADHPMPLPYERGNWFLQPENGWGKGNTIEEIAPNYVNPWKNGKTFSPSTLKNFLACPMRFWIQQVTGLNQDEILPDKESMSAAELGTVMHAALQQFCCKYATYENGLNEKLLRDDISGILERIFTEQYGESPSMPLLIQKYSMKQRLMRFAQLHLKDLKDGWTCIEFEKEVNHWSLGGYPMKFRIDRIDRHRDDRIRVIDYKTGAVDTCRKEHLDTLKNPETLKLLSENLKEHLIAPARGSTPAIKRWKNLQLPIYVLWAMETYGNAPAAAYYALPSSIANIALSEWEYLHEPQPGYETCDLLSAKDWAIELMRLISEGKGLVTAEELGWKVPQYANINQLLPESGKEVLQDLLNIKE